MATSTEATPAVAVQRFSASEPGAWSNAYLLSGGDEAMLFDVFQLASDATQLADAIDATEQPLTKVWISHAHPDHFLQLDRSDLVYNGAHLYLQEHNLDGWLARLDEFEQLAAQRGLSTIYPGHGPAGGLSLIQGTREYLQAFATALETGNPESARQAILSRFPDHHVEQFLDAFSLPAYFLTPPPTEPQKAR